MAKDEIDLTETKKPAVPGGNVTLNSDGFAYRTIMARLPEGVIADDLKEPGLWRKVQAGMLPLRRHDHLYIVSFDETWAADCIVADANGLGAVLSKPRIVTFPERYERLFQDDVYRVVWTGTGYAVERKADGKRMTKPAATAAIAPPGVAV